MADITAAMVKELRETTGAGMLDCKKALVEANGNMEQAVDWLRKKGLASAAKKSSRVAAEGLVAVAVDGNKRRVAFARESNVVPHDKKLAVPRSIGAHVLHRAV